MFRAAVVTLSVLAVVPVAVAPPASAASLYDAPYVFGLDCSIWTRNRTVRWQVPEDFADSSVTVVIESASGSPTGGRSSVQRPVTDRVYEIGGSLPVFAGLWYARNGVKTSTSPAAVMYYDQGFSCGDKILANGRPAPEA
jgi:hypothetical protein